MSRWIKFNLVGIIGAAIQLASLTVINHYIPGHYLYATAVAIEITLLHNFIWHWNYTWRDRRNCGTPFRQLLRFHLSNGLVSMLGNLALMRLLAGQAHLPPLAANAVAIVFCSTANFYLGNSWAFTTRAAWKTSS